MTATSLSFSLKFMWIIMLSDVMMRCPIIKLDVLNLDAQPRSRKLPEKTDKLLGGRGV